MDERYSEDTNLEWRRLMENKTPVYIWLNSVLGPQMFAITTSVDLFDGFWLDAFKNKQDAIKFCKKNKLPIIEIIEDEDRLIV